MSKVPSPLLGYNHNVRHKGSVFHIQTEDSGAKYGHIITHLFMDGGRILKSVKTSYAEYVGNERMTEIVREMMKQQHTAMFVALRDGKFDQVAEGTADPSRSTQALAAASPPKVDPPAAPPGAGPAPRRASVEIRRVSVEAAAAAPPPAAAAPAPVATRAEAPARAQLEGRAGPPPATPSADDLTVDVEAIERAAAAAAAASTASPAVAPIGDLPPPPANLFRERTAAGRYRVATGVAADKVASAQPRPEAPGGSARPRPPSTQMPAVLGTPPRGPSPASGGERRYAPTRPASIFGQAKPEQGKIFGEDLMGDKSLDEVILSYLAEDLDDEKK